MVTYLTNIDRSLSASGAYFTPVRAYFVEVMKRHKKLSDYEIRKLRLDIIKVFLKNGSDKTLLSHGAIERDDLEIMKLTMSDKAILDRVCRKIKYYWSDYRAQWMHSHARIVKYVRAPAQLTPLVKQYDQKIVPKIWVLKQLFDKVYGNYGNDIICLVADYLMIGNCTHIRQIKEDIPRRSCAKKLCRVM
jgi:hypothetical protein